MGSVAFLVQLAETVDEFDVVGDIAEVTREEDFPLVVLFHLLIVVVLIEIEAEGVGNYLVKELQKYTQRL